MLEELISTFNIVYPVLQDTAVAMAAGWEAVWEGWAAEWVVWVEAWVVWVEIPTTQLFKPIHLERAA